MTKYIEKAARALRSLQGYLHLMRTSEAALIHVRFDA